MRAIATGRKIFKDSFPTKVTVYLIEAQSLDFGWTFSPAIASAAEQVFQTITTDLQTRHTTVSTPSTR